MVIANPVIVVHCDSDVLINVEVLDKELLFKNWVVCIFLNTSSVLLAAIIELDVWIGFASSIISLNKTVFDFDDDGAVLRVDGGSG